MVKLNNRPALKTWNGLVNELFNDIEQNLESAVNQATNRAFPAVNIIETPEGFHAELLAAGRKKENFSIKVENNQLVVSYEQEKTERPAEWKHIRNEFNIGNFSRSFSFDEKVETNNIQAKYEDGLLKVFIPKKPEVKQAAVTINVL
jgi:HSP20 family protein